MSLDENNLPFKEMILCRTQAWQQTYDEQNRDRVADVVTTTMKKRGDNFGYLHRYVGASEWRPFTGKGMVSYPVVKRAIRAKVATSVATGIGIKIESIRRLPEKEAGAEMCESIYRYSEPILWTKKHESQIAELGATSRFCFIYNNYSTTGGMVIEVPETAERTIKNGMTEYGCHNCGFSYSPEELGMADPADGEEGNYPKYLTDGETENEESEMPVDEENESDEQDSDESYHSCPNCETNSLQLQSLATKEKTKVLTGNYRKVDVGMPDNRVISPLLIRIDSYGCLGFEYKNAGWFNFHPLIPIYQLLQIIPELEDKCQKGDYPRWSESARWHYELNNALLGASHGFRGYDYAPDELVEPNIWWISPKACHGWRSPENYECNGITINEGESIEEAFIRQFGEFRGCCVLVFDEEVFIIGNENFIEKWCGVPWMVDAQSFFPSGEEHLNKLQDAATNVLSMVYAHVQRMSNPKLVANGMMVDQEHVKSNQTGQIIWLKQTIKETENADWRRAIGYLQPTDLSQAVYHLIQLIIDIAKEESGVSDEMVGNSEQTETLGGREMLLNRGLGLMTPIQQGKGLAKIECVYQWMELWQRYAPDEAFQLLKGTFEEEWKSDDIAAFRKLDIRREIFVSVVQGTDVPKTQTEMEQRFITAVQMGLMNEPNQLPLEIRAHIVKQVLGIDYDVSNYYASRRVASRRLTAIKQELAGFEPNDAFTIEDDPNGIPQRVLRPEIISSLAQSPQTMVYQTDDHLTFIAYYTDQLNGLIGAREPDEVIIACLNKQIDAHRAILAAAAVQANAAQGIASNVPGAMQNATLMQQGGQAQPSVR